MGPPKQKAIVLSKPDTTNHQNCARREPSTSITSTVRTGDVTSQSLSGKGEIPRPRGNANLYLGGNDNTCFQGHHSPGSRRPGTKHLASQNLLEVYNFSFRNPEKNAISKWKLLIYDIRVVEGLERQKSTKDMLAGAGGEPASRPIPPVLT